MALEFDGVDQYLAGTNPALGTGDYTIIARFKTIGNNSMCLISPIEDVSGNYSFPRIVVSYIAEDSVIYIQRDVHGSLKFSFSWDNNLHQVAFKRESGSIYGYLDGVNQTITSSGEDYSQDGINFTGLNFWIQHFLFAVHYYYAGICGEIRIYNRALSLAEIKSIYYAQGADNVVANLVVRWLMNEKPDGETASGANVVIDISGNGNHGTPINSPVYRAGPVRLVRPVLLTPISGHFERTFTETLTLTDSVSKKTAKTFMETLHLTDTFSKAIKYYRTFTEKITLTDTVKIAKTNLVNLIKKLIQLMDIRRW